MIKQSAAIVLFAATLAGCATAPAPMASPGGSNDGVDGLACIGDIVAAAPGLVEAPNPPLVAQAQRLSGNGYLCSARSYVVTQPVRLYRLIDSTQPYSKLGSFWSFERPTGTRDDYRAKFAICKQWSQLDRLLSCDVRPGSMIVVGTTQSADCGDGITYAKTAANQVFVPNDGLAGIVHTGGCVDQGAWPAAGN